ncbi:MLP-like protein 31 [Silene latifolia]|uniref:MLP-like protein 31 n=1 Tax=Silene latifolia TaxID=37657 RepID=UPI003D77F7BB
MARSHLKRKLEGEVEITEVAGDVMHALFSKRPHHIPAVISEGFIHGCEVVQGAFGYSGSTIKWTYSIDGNTKTVTQIFDVIEGKNKGMDFICKDGDLTKDYENFVVSYRVIQVGHGSSKVVWKFEYEKKHSGFPEPTGEMDAFINITKDINDHHHAIR